MTAEIPANRSGQSRRLDVITELRRLVASVGHEDLPEVIGELARQTAVAQTRLLVLPTPEPVHAEPRDEPLLDASEVADMLGLSKRAVYRRAGEFPFTRRLGPRTLRFSRSGLRRWLKNQQGTVA